eukprot:c2145_g1_i1.p1 GENE.c2145_g1_i1~~c2145_g1_i1.p1  ORF type:complete len:361 (-),score=80.21 c2145_g1_i1:246-1286(-)
MDSTTSLAPTEQHCIKSAIPDLLTVVITTSPISVHPDTSLFLETVGSFSLVPELAKARKIIVCDGYKVSTENKFRSGAVVAEKVNDYEEYKNRLRSMTNASEGPLAGATMLELPIRHGFGLAVKRGLDAVATPFVMIVQHDRRFFASFDLLGLMQCMNDEANKPWLKYAMLPSHSTIGYETKIVSKYSIRLSPHVRNVASFRMVPLIQWFDSTHICQTDHYQNFVMNRKNRFVAKGGFIEDRMGPIQLADIRQNGMEAHAKYGTWIVEISNSKFECWLVEHLDSHDNRNSKKFRFVNQGNNADLLNGVDNNLDALNVDGGVDGDSSSNGDNAGHGDDIALDCAPNQ